VTVVVHIEHLVQKRTILSFRPFDGTLGILTTLYASREKSTLRRLARGLIG
jgi:hypothetical protein